MGTAAFYGTDLARVHASAFTGIGSAAASEVTTALARGSRVLDLGCGDGTTAAALTASGYRVVGIDRSAAMVELARAQHPGLSFEVADDANLPSSLGRFDAVLAIGEVLAYHGDGPARPLQARLAKLLALVEPGGLLLFDLPAPGRTADRDQRTWTTGDDWAVLAASVEHEDELLREIITFVWQPDGAYRRAEERHRLQLSSVESVLGALRHVGAVDARRLRGYAGLELPDGLVAYSARRGASPR